VRGLLQDLRFAVRMLAKGKRLRVGPLDRPWYTVVGELQRGVKPWPHCCSACRGLTRPRTAE